MSTKYFTNSVNFESHIISTRRKWGGGAECDFPILNRNSFLSEENRAWGNVNSHIWKIFPCLEILCVTEIISNYENILVNVGDSLLYIMEGLAHTPHTFSFFQCYSYGFNKAIFMTRQFIGNMYRPPCKC